MGRMYFCGVKHTIKEWMKSENKKTMVLLLLIEVMFFLFVMYKGLGKNYLPITVVLSLFTAVGCALVFYWKADRYLLVIAVLLVNIGFVIQEISESGMEVSKFLLKFSVAAVVMFLTPFLYHFFLKMLTYDVVVYGIMAVQILICLFLCFWGNMVGDAKNQGATLTLGIGKLSITAFEIVKVLYLFSASALLSKGGVKRVCIRGRWVSGEDILIVHTICLSVFFLFCNELGTLLIVYLTGLLMLWVFGEKKKTEFYNPYSYFSWDSGNMDGMLFCVIPQNTGGKHCPSCCDTKGCGAFWNDPAPRAGHKRKRLSRDFGIGSSSSWRGVWNWNRTSPPSFTRSIYGYDFCKCRSDMWFFYGSSYYHCIYLIGPKRRENCFKLQRYVFPATCAGNYACVCVRRCYPYWI